MSAKILE